MQQERKHGPAIWFPAPAIFAMAFLVALWLETAVYRIRPLGTLGATPRWVIGGAMVAAGLALMLWAFVTFRKAHTTVIPFRESSAVVADGPYRWSRNPIYVGDVLAYTGLAVAIDAGWMVVLLPVVLLIMRYYVIEREEAYLSRTFGAAYETYRAGVRRWL